MSVTTVPIETLYDGLYDGPHATPKPSDDGPVFLGIGNITEDGKLDLTDVRHIAEEDYPTWTKRVTPQPGDIVFTYEATLNRYAIIPEGFRGCLGRRTALIRPNPAAVNPRFLFFYFFSEAWRKTIGQKVLAGATVDRIPLTHFPTFPVNMPERPVQDRIADILSAYDDLIENNTRRIGILEEMAQSLHREWFVNLRFPGHKNVTMADSGLGLLPEGWTHRSLDTLMDFQGGAQPPKSEWIKEPRDGFIRMIQIRDYETDAHLGFVKDSRNLQKCRESDIMIARYGASVARICWGLAGAYNVALVRVMPHQECYCEFLRSYLSSDAFQRLLIGMSGRTAQAGFNKEVLKAITLPIPPDAALFQMYETLAKPMREMILRLRRTNNNLGSTRHFLLPKLISGEIPVEAADDKAAELIAAAT